MTTLTELRAATESYVDYAAKYPHDQADRLLIDALKEEVAALRAAVPTDEAPWVVALDLDGWLRIRCHRCRSHDMYKSPSPNASEYPPTFLAAHRDCPPLAYVPLAAYLKGKS